MYVFILIKEEDIHPSIERLVAYTISALFWTISPVYVRIVSTGWREQPTWTSIYKNNIGIDLCVFILSEFLDCEEEEEEEEGKWRHLREIRKKEILPSIQMGGKKYSSAASSSSLCVWLLLQDGRCAAEEVHILSQLLLLAPKKKEKFIRERVGVKGALLYTWNYPRKERGEISTCYPSIYRLHSRV